MAHPMRSLTSGPTLKEQYCLTYLTFSCFFGIQYLPDSILNHYYQLFYYTTKLQLFCGSCAVFCSKICFNRTIEIQLLLIAISVVHIAMGNLYDDVYDPNGALYLYLV